MNDGNSCHKYRDWLLELQNGETDDRLPDRLSEHVAGCADCRTEQTEMQETLELLGSLKEVEPPRHFFIYDESRQTTGWKTWWRTLLAPQTLALTSSLGFVLVLGVLAMGVHVRSEGTSVTLGFGTLPPLAEPRLERDPELLRADFRRMLAEELATRDRQIAEQVRSEISTFSNQLQTAQQQRIERVMASLNNRLDESFQERDHVLSESLRTVALEIYQSLLDQQQTSLQNLNARLRRVEAEGQIQGNQTEALVATVLELAQRRE